MDAAGHGDRQTKSSIILRLLDHAEHNWPQLTKVQASYHGSFAYITGVLPGSEQIPLFRLRYGGSARSFGFAIYRPGHHHDYCSTARFHTNRACAQCSDSAASCSGAGVSR